MNILTEHTVSYQHQAGLVGGFPVLQLEGEGALICRGQRLHDHLNHAGVPVEVHLVFLHKKKTTPAKHEIIHKKAEFPDTVGIFVSSVFCVLFV